METFYRKKKNTQLNPLACIKIEKNNPLNHLSILPFYLLVIIDSIFMPALASHLHFLNSEDVVSIAQQLIGYIIQTKIDGLNCTAVITECEAYRAPEDRASHAYNFKRSPKNDSMYASAGTVYMYICYGIHDMLNIVTGPLGLPHAVLIRSVQPITGIDHMLHRRGLPELKPELTSGPGNVSKSLGLTKSHNGLILNQSSVIKILSPRQPLSVPAATTRIGVESSGESALLPYRFVNLQSPFYSAKSQTKAYLNKLKGIQ
ncbi:MAG TPA: DNA-3-methyladenine glycosylase [Saprospiraceae bacterium]|nr:DNA-3-methyladenine glycosylase [Saprospiraceae bacterium]